MSITSLTPCAAFEHSAKYYDAIYWGRDKHRDIRHALHFYLQHFPPEAKTVVDWGCGTGEHLRLWKRANWKAIGFDPSPAMVEIAKRKGWDARLGGILDAVVSGLNAPLQTCLFAAFSYACGNGIVSPVPLFRKIKLNAARGGLFLFDVVNYSAAACHLEPFKRLEFGGGRSMSNGGHRVLLQRFDSVESLLHVDAIYHVRDGEFQELHSLRAFTPREITDHLDTAGFDVLSIFDPESPKRETPRPDSFYFMVAARVRG
jgi:SAM-dependent methyltransferase